VQGMLEDGGLGGVGLDRQMVLETCSFSST
jgi:hypothetical protein